MIDYFRQIKLVRIIANSANFVTLDCPLLYSSFRMHQWCFRWKDSREIWPWELPWKSATKIQIWPKSEENIGHCTWRPKYALFFRRHKFARTASLCNTQNICIFLTVTRIAVIRTKRITDFPLPQWLPENNSLLRYVARCTLVLWFRNHLIRLHEVYKNCVCKQITQIQLINQPLQFKTSNITVHNLKCSAHLNSSTYLWKT